MPSNTDDLFTVSRFSRVSGLNSRTITERIHHAGIKPVKRSGQRRWFDLGDLLRACFGERHRAEERRAIARAEMAEMESRERKGELFDRDKIREVHLRVVSIIGKRVAALPRNWSHRANPERPDVAMSALKEASTFIMQPIELDNENETSE